MLGFVAASPLERKVDGALQINLYNCQLEISPYEAENLF